MSTPAAIAPNQFADLVLTHAAVYTVSERQPRAQAVAIQENKIIYVGEDAEALKFAGKNTRVINLNGATVVPGLTDAHCHLLGIGQRELGFRLEGVKSLEEFLARVKDRVSRARPGEWIIGHGWIETSWNPPVFPTRWDLDTVAPDHPVLLHRVDGHAAVANSAVLKIAGIDRHTPNPFGGEIAKNSKGDPNGMLLDTAVNLAQKHVPPPTAEQTEEEAVVGARHSIEMGWCQVQDAGGTWNEVELFQKLYQQGRIKLRIYKAVTGPGPATDRLLRERPQVGQFDHRFTVRTIKVFADGALGSRGAALLEPYTDAPDTSGLLTVSREQLAPLLTEALRRGIQVEAHAIGDRANRFVMDAYEQAFRAVPPEQRQVAGPRWRVEHAQVVHPADIPRFARWGVIPSMQPSHAIGDLFFAPQRLGRARLESAYAWQSFRKAGCIIPGGSDAPVELGSPMVEFYAAVARRGLDGFQGEGWYPEQAVSREDALKMFTLWPAYAAFEEKYRGSIEPGKLADLTVLSADIMQIPEADILKTRPVMTVIGGEVVFEQ